MARTIQQINAAILADIASRTDLAGLNSTSAVSVYRLLVYVVAVAIATLENLFDLFQVEVGAVVAAMKPHTLRWYQAKALAWQLGYDLPIDSDVYDNTGIDPDIVFDSKIVEHASVTEQGVTLKVKVAKNSDPTPLSAGELAGLTAYMNEIKDAGVRMEVISVSADRLRGEIDIYYDPTVLDALGRRLNGSATNPVFLAAQEYLKVLRFDGRFFTSLMIDRLQTVEGVVAPYVRRLEVAAAGDPNYVTIEATHEPFSGFMRFYNESDLVINYIPIDA